ncbi:hypothetical protein INT45_009741 [Circinella minor]|uniref:Uncharacterized protein n=1 Tax=Circinella minor TaxID=1195481 RepID=A0A8H7S424_9FUNG|nr:hypothetical protein INT45_009741 [Circinella minor]
MAATDGRRREKQQQQKFLYHHEKSKGMYELLVHSRTPGGLVCRPVSFNNIQNNVRRTSIIVKLTIALDGSLFFAKHLNHNNIIQSIQDMAQDYHEHIAKVLLLLDKLLKYQEKQSHYSPPIKAALIGHHGHKSNMEIILPSAFFSPHSPSKGRARIWLQSIMDIDPATETGFVISEQDGDTQPIDSAYFRELQLFLDQVDSMIGNSFSNIAPSSLQSLSSTP